MIPAETREEILRRIHAAEKEHNIKVLYAIESGSRAWGFASANSDFDVRFVYVRKQEWYLGIDLEDKRDVVEYPIVDEIDINGWDIRKALQLFRRSNPSIIEWLLSPIVYIDNDAFASELRDLIPECYHLDKGIYHYRSMAKTNYRGYLQQELVPLKKYFYVLRPLLAIRWIKTYKEPAPIEFERLRRLLVSEPEVDAEVSRLLVLKKQATEKLMIERSHCLNDFIERELAGLEQHNPEFDTPGSDVESLNMLFRKHMSACQR